MPPASRDPLDRLARAVEIALNRSSSATDPDLLTANPDLRDLLEPLLTAAAPPGDVPTHRSATPQPAGAEPVRLGPYRLVRELGRGGQSEVHLARDTRLDRLVALKLLRAPWFAAAERLERFRREALIASRLDHPGICTVFEASVEDGLPYIAMRFLAGETLAAGLHSERSARRVPARSTILTRVRQVATLARTLQAAHEAGVLHRDLKPANVMIGPDGQPVILDFGLARTDEPGEALTQTNAIFGTPAYMAPEQVSHGSGATDRRTDVYALGVILYECVAGRRPFDAATTLELYRCIREDEPQDPRRCNPEVPQDLATVIATAMAKEPASRYVSATALADDLEAVLAGRPVAVRPISTAARLWRWARREPVKATLAVTLLTLLPLVASLATYSVMTRDDVEATAARKLDDRVEAMLEDGYFQLGEERWDQAAAAFEQAVSLNARSVEARAGLALTKLRAGDAAGSLGLLRSFDGRTPALLRVQVEALRATGDATGADALARTIPAPATGLDLFLAGCTEMSRATADRSDASRRALDHLERAMLMPGSDRAFYLYQLAYAAGHAGDRAAAERVARTLVARWPTSAMALLRAGFALTLTGALGDALPIVRDGLRRLPESASGHLYLATIHLGMGLPKEALHEAETVVNLRPDGADGWSMLGLCRMKLGQPQAAEEALRKSMALRPGRPEDANGIAMCLWQTKGLDAARGAFETLTRQSPDFPDGWCNLGMALGRSQNLDGAIAAYRKAIELRPDFAEALSNLGLTLQKKGELNAAIDVSRKALASAPWSVPIRNNLAVQLKDAGGADEAVPILEEALRLDADDANAHCNLGLAFVRLGRFHEALVQLRTGHELASRRQDWKFPSQSWIDDAERLVELEDRLDEVRAGRGPAPTPGERVLLAGSVCRPKRRHSEAARLYGAALEAEPSIARDRTKTLLVTAARSALAAAAGEAVDAPPDARERAELRDRALLWLRQELSAREDDLDGGASSDEEIRTKLSSWTDPGPLLRTSTSEWGATQDEGARTTWKALWERWRDLALRAGVPKPRVSAVATGGSPK